MSCESSPQGPLTCPHVAMATWKDTHTHPHAPLSLNHARDPAGEGSALCGRPLAALAKGKSATEKDDKTRSRSATAASSAYWLHSRLIGTARSREAVFFSHTATHNNPQAELTMTRVRALCRALSHVENGTESAGWPV